MSPFPLQCRADTLIRSPRGISFGSHAGPAGTSPLRVRPFRFQMTRSVIAFSTAWGPYTTPLGFHGWFAAS